MMLVIAAAIAIYGLLITLQQSKHSFLSILQLALTALFTLTILTVRRWDKAKRRRKVSVTVVSIMTLITAAAWAAGLLTG